MQGGYREGAGRKRGFAAKHAEEARKYLSERVSAEIGALADALILKAKKGDIVALRELFDRAWGKARQSVDVSTKDTVLTSPYFTDPRVREAAARHESELKEILRGKM